MKIRKTTTLAPELPANYVPPKRDYSRPNGCGIGAHFSGYYEYRVIVWSTTHNEWTTLIYTEYLDRALEVRDANSGRNAVVQECAWRELGA